MATPVVVVHYRAPDWCARTIERVLASEGLDPAVLVVDNSGDLPTDRLPAQVEVLRPPANLGYAGGANLGIRRALQTAGRHPPDHVVVCCHDVDPAPGTLAALGEALRADAGLGVVGPRLVSPRASAGGSWSGWAAHERVPSPDDPPMVDVDWVSGACLVVRTACLMEVGGFDERFGSYAEDVDLCLRARDVGWQVACLSSAVAASEGSVAEDRTRLAARNAVLLVAKREGTRAAWRATLRYSWRAARGALGSLAVHHARDRRRVARAYAMGNLEAILDVSRPGVISDLAKRPGAGVARFGAHTAWASEQLGSASSSE